MREKKLLNQFAPLFKNSFKNQELKHIQLTEYCIYTKSQSTLRYTRENTDMYTFTQCALNSQNTSIQFISDTHTQVRINAEITIRS